MSVSQGDVPNERAMASAAADTPAIGYVIGAQKAGTTWLHAQLAGHRDVHMPPRKEVHYWNTVRAPFDREARLGAELGMALTKQRVRENWWKGSLFRARFRRNLQIARRRAELFRRAGAGNESYIDYMTTNYAGQRIMMDISPDYALLQRTSFAEMLALTPDARFIFIMRDPVDRMWSAVRYRYSLMEERGATIDVATLVREFEIAAEVRDHPDARLSQYRATIEELEAAAPPSKVLFLFFETLFRRETTDRIAEFLGIGSFDADFATAVNAGTNPNEKPSPEAMARARRSLGATYDYVFDRFGDEVPDRWRR